MGSLRRSALFLTVFSLLALAGCGSGVAVVPTAGASLQISSSLPPAVSGMMYSSALQASGSSHYTWSVVTGAMPSGLELEKSSGTISGVPQTVGTTNFAVSVADDLHAEASRVVPVSFVVVPQLAVVDATMPPCSIGSVFFKQILLKGGQAPYVWSAPTGQLPPGITARDGIFLGIPTANGTYNFSFQVSDSGSPKQVLTVPLTIQVGAPLTISAVGPQKATYGTPFSLALSGTGGTPSYTWSVTGGSLPAGLNLSSATGLLSGTPSATGTYTAQIAMQDHNVPFAGATSTSLSITVAAAAMTMTAPAASTTPVGTAFQASFPVAGGIPAYTWSAVGALPPGISLNAATGALSGTPTAAGVYSFGIQATDSDKPAQSKTVATSVIVSAKPLVITAPALSSGTVNSAYQAAFQATGGTPSYIWTALGTLPAGLSLNPTTGLLSGTPSTAGTYSFAVQVSDGGKPAQTSAATASITVANAMQAMRVAAGTTWYVRKDGGTRYGPNRTNGQCDGKGDAAYNGIGVNQHCAFNDVRYLWQDGNYDNGTNQGWVIAGGDTVILRGSIGSGATYRIGWNNKDGAYEQSTDTFWGIPGDPYGSYMPVPPAGTASQHTRILGENYGSCHNQTDRTQLHGGFGVSTVVNLQGASYVDMQCLDITDFSACGRASQTKGCNTNPGTLDDYANNGIFVDNTTNHVTMTDVRIHGLANVGLFGPTGDGNVYSYFDIIGNAGAGWNADNGTVGKGTTLVQNFNISWNGCTEEYPIQSALPYNDCTDDNVGGYGDGFGTATINSTVPWNITFDTGTVSYNTQDGLDALHLIGAGSSMTITRVQAFGNMGQQIKVGGAGGSATNNVIVTNCNAMRMAIPGTPAGYNSRLTDFCRAADTGIYMATQDGSTTYFDYNTVYSASATTVEIGCGGTCSAGTDLIDFRNNILLGFKNNAVNGYIYGNTNDYANPIYVGGTRTFNNQGSVYDHNVTFHAKSTWSCPSNSLLHETNAICADPGLVDETWHNYGMGTMSPVPGVSLALGAGITLPNITISINGQTRATPPTIGAYEQ